VLVTTVLARQVLLHSDWFKKEEL